MADTCATELIPQPAASQRDMLTPEDRAVFDALEEARGRYSIPVVCEDNQLESWFQEPTAEDYSWDKPLTFSLTG